MKYLLYGHSPNVPLILTFGRWVRHRIAGHLTPIGGRLLWLSRQQPARAVAAYVLLILGLVMQLLLLLVAAYMVDLSLSLMELWAELARKHLELTL